MKWKCTINMICIVLLLWSLPAQAKITKTQRDAIYKLMNRNDLSTLHRLLDEGLDVNARIGGNTLLMKAANIGSADLVKLLIKRGADINATDQFGENALMKGFSNSKQYVPISKILLDNGIDVTISNTRNGYNPVWQISSKIKKGDPQEPGFQILEQVLKKGADPNARYRSKNKKMNGMTPLMSYSQKGFDQVAKLLLYYGANREARSTQGETALDFAKKKNRKKVILVLQTYDASTPLKWNAVQQGEIDPEALYEKCKNHVRAPWCFQEAIEKSGEARLCEDILKYWPKAVGVHGWCYYRLAVKNQDCSLCRKIKKQDIHRTCNLDACP